MLIGWNLPTPWVKRSALKRFGALRLGIQLSQLIGRGRGTQGKVRGHGAKSCIEVYTSKNHAQFWRHSHTEPKEALRSSMQESGNLIRISCQPQALLRCQLFSVIMKGLIADQSKLRANKQTAFLARYSTMNHGSRCLNSWYPPQ